MKRNLKSGMASLTLLALESLRPLLVSKPRRDMQLIEYGRKAEWICTGCGKSGQMMFRHRKNCLYQAHFNALDALSKLLRVGESHEK